MPIGGFVVSCQPEAKEKLIQKLSQVPEAEIYADEDRGVLILVLESKTSEALEELVNRISAYPEVLTINLAYLHGEDEVERILDGRLRPPIRWRKGQS
ncbi:chaperone NapD [Thermosulfuriphilus sp.]